MGEIVEDRPWSEFEKDPLTALIDGQHGVVARWQALRFLTEKAVRHRVATGRWRRVHRAVYLTYGGSITLTQRHWIAVLAGTPGPSITESTSACLGGLSALLVHGLRGVTSDRVHLIAPSPRQVIAPPRTVVHRVQLPDDLRHPASRPPTTTIARAVVDAAAWARSNDEARLIIAASFQQRLVSAPEIEQVLKQMPTTRRRRLVIATSADAAGGSHSLGELDLAGICRKHRLPLPTRQVTFRDANRRQRFLDAVFDPWRLAVEVDGAHHDDVAQRWDDFERENDLVQDSFTVLRFPVHVVRERPHHVAARIRAALERAGWRPPAARSRKSL
jgi:very-short-patch-repair endonuclease